MALDFKILGFGAERNTRFLGNDYRGKICSEKSALGIVPGILEPLVLEELIHVISAEIESLKEAQAILQGSG